MTKISLECHIGLASKIDIPVVFSDPQPEWLKKSLMVGSRGIIELLPKNRTNEPSLVADDKHEVDALDLHLCVEKLFKNVPSSSGKISKIALILAGLYSPMPGLFGVMFDRGYADRGYDDIGDPNNIDRFTGIPREGCAIFIDAIQKLRPNIDDFDHEVEFTTIHEIGHVFNLGHDTSSAARNYMATSKANYAFPINYFNFSDEQMNWLEQCDSNELVYPGGSIFDPTLGNAANEPAQNDSTAQITLNIGVANTIFPCLCPIELDVELLAMSGTNRHFFVPDRLDPGYEELKIWITYPNREKRLFRSPRRYCAPPSRVMLGKGRSLRRDISLFEGAVGTTFAKPGLYHIQAEYNLGRRGCVSSNVVTVEAVLSKQLMPSERVRLFADHSVRRFLYHRSTKCGSGIVRELEKHLISYPEGAGANDIRYALVRALAGRADTLGSAEREGILKHIQGTHDIDGELGVRQRYHIQKLFEAL